MRKSPLKIRKIFLNKFNRTYQEFLKFHSNEFVISENELNEMKLDVSIITEDIFRIDEFTKLFDFINNSKEYNNIILNPREMADFFPVKSNIRKKLLKPYFNKPLYVSIIDENSIDEIENSVNFWTNLNEDNEYFCKFVSNVYNSFSDASAIFYMTENNKGIMFLKKEEFDVEDLRHEFIHYFKWALNDMDYSEIDESFLKTQEKRISEFSEMFDLSEDDIEYFSDFDEFETILNDAITALKNIKEEKFLQLSKNEYSDLIFRTFFFNKKKTNVSQYLKKLKECELIDDIENEYSLQFIIFNVVINYNVNKIKTHIFSELTNKKGFTFR